MISYNVISLSLSLQDTWAHEGKHAAGMRKPKCPMTNIHDHPGERDAPITPVPERRLVAPPGRKHQSRRPQPSHRAGVREARAPRRNKSYVRVLPGAPRRNKSYVRVFPQAPRRRKTYVWVFPEAPRRRKTYVWVPRETPKPAEQGPDRNKPPEPQQQDHIKK